MKALTLAIFAVILALTLYITWWAAKRTRTTSEFYAAGGALSARQNGFALAAVIISSVVIVVGIIVLIVLISVFASAAGDLVQFCLDNPAGVYEVNGQTITCGG